MKNRFLLAASDDEDGSVLWVARVLLLFGLKSPANGGRAEYILALDAVVKELCSVRLRWSTTDEKEYSAVAWGTELLKGAACGLVV